jgi:hypothetical protein
VKRDVGSKVERQENCLHSVGVVATMDAFCMIKAWAIEYWEFASNGFTESSNGGTTQEY